MWSRSLWPICTDYLSVKGEKTEKSLRKELSKAVICPHFCGPTWGWERRGRRLSPLPWGRGEHRISLLKPFGESFKCVENTCTHFEPTCLEPGRTDLLVTTGVYQVKMKMAETRTETWLPFRHKNIYIYIRFTHQSVTILVSLMQFPARADPQVPDKILSPKLVNWRRLLGSGDPTKSLPPDEKCQGLLLFFCRMLSCCNSAADHLEGCFLCLGLSFSICKVKGLYQTVLQQALEKEIPVRWFRRVWILQACSGYDFFWYHFHN